MKNIVETIVSPFFSKIKFEDYRLGDENHLNLTKKVFEKIKIENSNLEKTTGIPFPLMTTTDDRVWGKYCPNKQKLAEIKIALPKQVLELIEKYHTNFDWLEVWYESKDQVDPILVGCKWKNQEDKEKGYSWNVDKFLMCRWGESLKSFEEIVSFVKEKMYQEKKTELETNLATLRLDVDKYLNGGWSNNF